jgi:hypothetical protein
MKTTLSQVEAQLQRLVEGSLARLFPSEWKDNRLASHLLEAMRENLEPEPSSERMLAPDVYTIFLPAYQAGESTNPQLAISLANDLIEATQESDIRFKFPPTVQIVGDANLGPDQIRVLAQFRKDQMNETQSFLPAPSQKEYAQHLINAFLIHNRSEIFPIDSPIVTIGRQWDADLIIDDPRVSRLHAQIRIIDKRFVVFDLGSTAGTFVNGQRVQQRVLVRGDVLSLAGVDLIFGQEESEDDETRPMKKSGISSEPFA